MTGKYFGQIPESTGFRAIFEEFENFENAVSDVRADERKPLRKDTEIMCFKQSETDQPHAEAVIKDKIGQFSDELSFNNNKTKRITIIGAGASGVLLAINLLRGDVNYPLEINLIDKKENIGRGVAYSTDRDCHLLNVPAAKMGAFPEDVGHFYNWLAENNYKYQPNDFVPRRIYGDYLREVISKAIEEKKPNVRFNLINDEAIDILGDESGAQVILQSGEILFSDRVVLAFGNFPPPLPPVPDLSFADSAKYFQNCWDNRICDKISPNDDVLIIGTGLSMVDAALTFRQIEHKGKIFALSTRGLLPAAHRFSQPIPAFNGEITSQFRISGILKTVREKIEKEKASGNDWRVVIDALRPITQTIWLNLDVAEKRRFMRHLRRIWEISRHRMPVECANILAEMRSSSQLHIKKGRLLEINPNEQGSFEVFYANRGLRNKISVDAIINCMGSESNLNRVDYRLVKNLLAKGIIAADPLNLGIKALPDGRVINEIGSVSDTIYTLGTALRGILWESTAIPEIRAQAGRLALSLVV